MAVSTEVTFAHRIEALGFDLYLNAFGALPMEAAGNVGAAFLRAVGPLVPAHQTALKNLRLAFPDESERWRKSVADGMWAEIGRTAGEFPHLSEINAYAEDGRIEVEGVERLDQVKASGKGAVFISGHFSNWEIMPVAIAQRGVVCHMTYRPANNPLVDRRILHIRRTYGADLQAAKGKEGGMGLLRALARGSSVALMNDQKYAEGLPTPFFGHTAMTADGPARLALRHGVPLIPFALRRIGNETRFRVTIHPPIEMDPLGPPAEVLQKAVSAVSAFIEARVREAPEQWFWVHRRWPKEAWEAAGVA